MNAALIDTIKQIEDLPVDTEMFDAYGQTWRKSAAGYLTLGGQPGLWDLADAGDRVGILSRAPFHLAEDAGAALAYWFEAGCGVESLRTADGWTHVPASRRYRGVPQHAETYEGAYPS